MGFASLLEVFWGVVTDGVCYCRFFGIEFFLSDVISHGLGLQAAVQHPPAAAVAECWRFL